MVQLGCSAVATVVVVTAMARAMYRAAVQQSICIQSDHSLGNLKFPDISPDSSGTPIHVLLPTSCIYFLTVLPVQYKHTHTSITTLLPGLPGKAGTRKEKPIWILLKQETVSGSGISWAICKSAPHSRQITTPAPRHSVFYKLHALPAAQPTVSKH